MSSIILLRSLHCQAGERCTGHEEHEKTLILMILVSLTECTSVFYDSNERLSHSPDTLAIDFPVLPLVCVCVCLFPVFRAGESEESRSRETHRERRHGLYPRLTGRDGRENDAHRKHGGEREGRG